MDRARDAVLPLRPLTVGELLDASVGVLRRCGWPLLAAGLLLAVVFQVLSGLAADGFGLNRPDAGLLDSDRVLPFTWLWLACRFGMEASVIALLGAPAAAAAGSALLGEPAPAGYAGPLRWLVAPGRRWWGVLAIAVVVGGVAMLATLLCGIPWLAVYGLTGLLVPVLVVDRSAGAQTVPRALRLVFAGGCRAAGIRLLGYLGWLLVRLAVGYAGSSLVDALDPPSVWTPLLTALPWILVDTVAFPAMACLDASIHLENRMRAEGLDLALGRGDRGALEVV